MDRECLVLRWKHYNLRGMVFGWQKRADCAKTKTANPVPVLVLDWSKAAQEELVERVRVVVGMVPPARR